MKLKIDLEADALYLTLQDEPASESEEVASGIILDYSADGQGSWNRDALSIKAFTRSGC